MSARAAPRWAVSFADLALLLLGCFVLLHALQPRPRAATPVPASAGVPAERLFEPGEARLTAAGRARIAALAAGGGAVVLSSRGGEERNRRLDSFELAAARTAAVARALHEAGLAEQAIAIEQVRSADGPQRIAVTHR